MSNIRSKTTLPFLILTILLSVTAAQAQSTTATLSGTVTDQQDAIVAGATVTITNPATGLIRTVQTGESGSFIFALLPPANYRLAVERTGFSRYEVTEIVLNVADQKSLRIQLKVGQVTDAVEVRADAATVRTDGAVSTVVDRQFVGNLPLNGRSFQSLITLTPGVVQTVAGVTNTGQFSVNGQRSNANYFSVDGVGANIGVSSDLAMTQQAAGTLPGLAASGGTNNLVSVDALQEFSIQTSTYAPEFGRSPGGQVSIVTRSGTNDFTGAVFEYFRNEAFDANNWFNNRARLQKPPLRQHQYGGVIGGPIYLPSFGEGGPHFRLAKRSFFFFSFEAQRLLLPQTVVTTVPSLSLRQSAAIALQPILNAFPKPTGTIEFANGTADFVAAYANPSLLHATSFRIDHSVNDKLNLFGRYNNSPSKSATRALSQVSTIYVDTQTLTLGATYIASSKVNNDLRFNWSKTQGGSVRELDNFGGAVPVADETVFPPFISADQGAVRFTMTNIGSLQFGTFQDNLQRQLNLVDNFSYMHGDHQLKFGVDYRRLAPIYGPQAYGAEFRFNNRAAVESGILSQASVFAQLGAEPTYTNFSAYGQDTWKVTPRLSLTYGLRWDVNPPPREANGNDARTVMGVENLADIDLAPDGTPLFTTKYNSFAPRLGVAYQLSQKNGRETVLRGGFGLFYDLGNGGAADAFTFFPFSSFGNPLVGIPYPITVEQATPPPFSNIPSRAAALYYEPKFSLPYTLQWNFAVEQSLGSRQTVSASYVGSAGRRLLRTRSLLPTDPEFTQILVIGNGATSDYHSLQLQFQRRLTHGLQALVNYTWSHAIDDVSAEINNSNAVRGNADFDVRHNFSTAITYDLPTPKSNTIAKAIFGQWAVDTIVRANSAPPVSVFSRSNFNVVGTQTTLRPNLVPGVPIYIDDPAAPGGMRINFHAFQIVSANGQGDLGRNVVRGFSFYQIDLAFRRQFNFNERMSLQLRAEAFNLLNHPNFGPPNGNLGSGEASFGLSTSMLAQSLRGLNALYQSGGPRSMQFVLRFQF